MVALEDVKKFIGIPITETIFDDELITFMNEASSYLYNLGIDALESKVFVANSSYTLTNDQILNNYIKIYTAKKVKLEFDPSANTNVQNARTESLDELEHKILLRVGQVARLEE